MTVSSAILFFLDLIYFAILYLGQGMPTMRDYNTVTPLSYDGLCASFFPLQWSFVCVHVVCSDDTFSQCCDDDVIVCLFASFVVVCFRSSEA